MCGLVAFIDFSKNISNESLEKATDTMVLRGPDARGFLVLKNNRFNIGFGHRRLAILDLEERSNQPFEVGNLVIVFNGEIYNFEEIKESLIQLDYSFKTTSDTEVVINAYKEWGDDCFHKFIGMFAIVIYDKAKQEFTIVRDRLGVKPLYVFKDKQKLILASETKVINSFFDGELPIDKAALHGFFSLGYVPGKHSIYKNVEKINPGTITKLYLEKDFSLTMNHFWNVDNLNNTLSNLTLEQKRHNLSSILKDAIKLRLVADVEVGSFLSGGLDSSYVTKLMHAASPENNLKTFTIGFNEKFDEAPHAENVANFIGTKHKTHYLKPDDVTEIIQNYANYFDEPFSDDAAIPMLFLSRMSKEDVKVVISSDGGDEVFAGYSRYVNALNAHKKLNKLPNFVLFTLKNSAQFSYILLPKRNKISNFLWRISHIINKNKDRQLANILFYGDRIPTAEMSTILQKSILKSEFDHNYYSPSENKSPIKKLLSIDIKESLVNQMLVKVDKSTMGASIEGREPLLDHRLFEFMFSCDDEDFILDGKTKHLFRQIISEEFQNSEILNKPKMGFNTPILNWLKDHFSDFVENEFQSISKNNVPFINQIEIIKMWNEFKLGKVYYKSLIWRTLIYILWYKKYSLK